MQLDLLYKGLPSAKADTRKFRVQIHSNAISFTQHEGRGGQGGGGRKGHFPHILPPLHPPAPSDLPSITFPPFQDGKTNQKGGKKKGKGCGKVGASPEEPGSTPPRSPSTHLGPPGAAPGSRRSPSPQVWPVPPFPNASRTKTEPQGDAPGRRGWPGV